MGKLNRLLLAATALAGLVLAFALWQHDSRVSAAWAEMLARADALQKELEARDPKRPVLWGEAEPGNAWNDYQRAFSAVRRVADKEKRWKEFLDAERNGEGSLASSIRDAFADDCEEALAALRAGARKGQVERPIDWEQGTKIDVVNLLDTRWLVNAAVLEAIRLEEQGDPMGSVHLLLDAMQLGRDLMHTPVSIETSIGCAALRAATNDAFLERGLVGWLSRTALVELQRGVDRLQQSIAPVEREFEGGLVLFVREINKPEGYHEHFEVSAWQAWRYGFSVRSLHAAHARDLSELLESSKEFRGLSPAEEHSGLETLAAELEDSANPFSAGTSVSVKVAASARKHALDRLQELRNEVDSRLTPTDPR